MEDEELKTIDTFTVPKHAVFPDVPWRFTPTGTFVLLNLISSGTGYNQRVGTKIRMKRIQLMGSILANQNAIYGQAPTRCRILIVWDKDANAAPPMTLSDLFADPTYPATSPLNLDKRGEHVIIMDSLKCTGYTTSRDNIIETFWTKTDTTATNNTILTYGVIPSPPGPPTINVVTTYSDKVTDMGGGVGMNVGIQNNVKTIDSCGPNHIKVKKDYFVDLYAYFKDTITPILTTGGLWLILVSDPISPGITNNQWYFEGSVRVRFVDEK